VVVLSLDCRCCRLSVNTICGRIIIGFIVVVVNNLFVISLISLLNIRNRPPQIHCLNSDGTGDLSLLRYKPDFVINLLICGRIVIGLSLLSSVSKHNMWSYYHWVYCCCRPSVNIICGRIMIGLSLLSSVSKHNMWSYYDWV
jgi:hypothetical protein